MGVDLLRSRLSHDVRDPADLGEGKGPSSEISSPNGVRYRFCRDAPVCSLVGRACDSCRKSMEVRDEDRSRGPSRQLLRLDSLPGGPKKRESVKQERDKSEKCADSHHAQSATDSRVVLDLECTHLLYHQYSVIAEQNRSAAKRSCGGVKACLPWSNCYRKKTCAASSTRTLDFLRAPLAML